MSPLDDPLTRIRPLAEGLTRLRVAQKVRKVPARRSQKWRSAQMQERLIAATFDLLHQHGYAGASTVAIARHAGVSLGALQHQFPTKAILMATVLRRFAAHRIGCYRAALRGVPRGLPRFEALSRASWELIGSRELTASMEIELAMRNDPELAAVAKPRFERHAAFMRRLISKILADHWQASGRAVDERQIEVIRLLNNAILLGLSLERNRAVDPAAISMAVERWRELLVDGLVAPGKD